jgi:hypothetical protein
MGKIDRLTARIGLIVGCAGFALLALAQLARAYAAVLLLLLVALGAGLATAKWLSRTLYGQQFMTGLRAGALACGIASFGMLVSLAVGSHSSVEALAQRSHLLGVHLESVARALHVLGWLGVGLLFALIASLVGTGLAGVVAQLAAWDKNQHAIQVIERAREAAQRSGGRNALGAPLSGAARRPTGALPVLPVYPPLGHQTSESGYPSAPLPGDPAGYAPRGGSQQEVLHDALAAWAEGANRGGTQDGAAQPGRESDQPQRPATDRDNWLC